MYGREIRVKRNNVGMSLTTCASILGYSKAALSRYETGESAIPPDMPARLDITFETDGLFGRLYEMVEHDQFPDRYRAFMTLAATAIQILEYAGQTIPGLLQTPDYARAQFIGFEPGAPTAEIERRVIARINRQRIFTRKDPPRYDAILDQAAIARPIGGPAVMRAQLETLLPRMDTQYGTIQVLPFDAGAHSVLGGSLTLLTLPDSEPVAYLEGSHTGQLREDPTTVADHQAAYDRLRAYALSPRESAAMIRAVIQELEAWERPEAQTSRHGERARTATGIKATVSRSAMISRASSRYATRKTRASDT
ncbi:transcriptional regulator [Embleya hyalina]|uniref:Transcriptional regulator n=1 Tax=Embleya hyalina TaxID=516124 RepID=A0A401YFW5_9ACTN|nr:transcriptional regulator [Embleya hyalina]